MSDLKREPLDRPNIILVNCDDLGYGDIGPYGSKRNKTPYLDRMAEEGTVFTDFYMASPVCSPSRGGMLTGCYPPRIGFDNFNGAWVLFPGYDCGLNPKEVTFARILKDQGYATKHVGKWHCGDQPEFMPTRHGFDSYYGLPYSNDMGHQLGREHMPPLPLLRDEEVIQEQPDQVGLTERYVEECVRFIRENKDEPFLLYFAHMYVHLPIYTPDRFMRESENGVYGAAVACVDWSIGVLMDELKRQGIEKNTLVIFTSDNGSRARDEGGSNDPLRGTKGTTWEGGQRLPFVAWWPDTVPAGRRNSSITASIDFMPTFAKLAGGEAPKDRTIDGKDISELLLGKTEESPRDTFFYYAGSHLDAVRKGKWKLFIGHNWRSEEVVCELYDLENDIAETTDVSEQHPDVVKELQGMLEACKQDLGDARTGVEGQGRREIGRVENAKPLTEYNEDHPYIIAMYDIGNAG
ncbi:MAG: sulfatase [Candidatus Sumerlaeia bacterium]